MFIRLKQVSLFFLIIAVGLIVFVFFKPFFLKKEKKSVILTNPPAKADNYQKKKINLNINSNEAIFVVNWMIDNESEIDLSGYCPIIFFGDQIRFNKEQIKNGDCQDFFYTVKVTDADFSVGDNFFNQIKSNGFNGVVIDLEIAGISSDNLVEKINNLVDGLGKRAKEANLKFLLAVYGDTFYRHRPYDIDFFAKISDGIMIMAYDFSKSYGEPGPNFPYSGREKYGYDFQQMVSDFLRFVPAEKLTVIFGMYGYDWIVDEQKRPFSQAKALTLKEIEARFINTAKNLGRRFDCAIDNCIIRRDPLAKETEINYTISANQPDEDGIYRIDYHIVWFEDKESVEIKKNFLREKGIGSIAYWAWGYF